jgi:signal peptidase II
MAVFTLALAVTALLDQGSKAWARGALVPGTREPLIDGWWDWELAFNTGAAFSSFEGALVVLGAIAIAALVAVVVMATRAAPEHGLRRLALALIGGGTLGNLIDRVRDGAVTDFVRWRAGEHLWPIFNVADVALVIGVALLFLEGPLSRARRPSPVH